MTGAQQPRPATLRWVRYGGLAGAVLLALVAWRGGVLPGPPPASTPGTIWRGPYGPWILIGWFAGTAALTVAWWSLRRSVPSLRWAYVTAGLWLVPLLLAPPLGSRDLYSYACQGAVFSDGGDLYGAGVAELGCPWVESVALLWRDTPTPYGPVFLLLAGLAATLGGSLTGTLLLLRGTALAAVVLIAVCLPGLARYGGVPPRRAVWVVLACPLVSVHLISGAHNDALMIALVAAGLLVSLSAARRSGGAAGTVTRFADVGGTARFAAVGVTARLAAAGVLLGCAVAVKATALVALPFAMLAPALAAGAAGVRVGGAGGGAAPGRWWAGQWWTGRWWAGAGVVLAGAVAALAAASALAGLGLGWVGALGGSDDLTQWTSPPTAVGFVVNYIGQTVVPGLDAVPWTRAAALVLLALFLVGCWLRTLRRLRAGAGAEVLLWGVALAMTATVACAPVVYPWYLVWPLVLLAVVARRTTALLVVCTVAAFLLLPDSTNLARFAKAPGAIVVTLVLAVLLGRLLRQRRASRRA
ncbi:polyprenol phosphomannose-dependent alpha 1,6 mannosyltransferase MptB [Micromonosporaceae bacterium DT55]|uniref:polyprenol phosphomannose-dependent alpha 1,6 mannosyltransferase MptB n=1 Tax=Melissospora conviva TaxID=3388432 RepID=UPI003C1DADFE